MLQWTCQLQALDPVPTALFGRHLQRLTPAHRADRFGGWVSDDFLIDYAERTPLMRTHVIGCLPDGDLRATLEIRPFDPDHPIEAEAALSIEEAWQSQGLGTALVAEARSYALSLGIGELVLCYTARNTRMRRIAERATTDIVWDDAYCIARLPITSASGLPVA